MREPKFSIIVPVYKVEDYLQACVDSLLVYQKAHPNTEPTENERRFDAETDPAD